MIAAIIAAVLSLFGTDAGLITEPAPSPYSSDAWGEVPILPTEAYSDPDLCVPVPVDEASDEAIEYLLDAGWVGSPGDGMEALYPQGCTTA